MSIQILFTVYKTQEVRIKQVPSKTCEVQILPLHFLRCSSLLPFTHLSSSSFPSSFFYSFFPSSSSSLLHLLHPFPFPHPPFPFILFLSPSSSSSSFPHLPLCRLHHSRRGKERLRCPSFPLESQDWDQGPPPTASHPRGRKISWKLWDALSLDELIKMS